MPVRRPGLVRRALAVVTTAAATVALGVSHVAVAQAAVDTSPSQLVVLDDDVDY